MYLFNFLKPELIALKVLVPGAVHALHGQTMEWIFNHGARAVVTTSQLHTRGEITPIVVNTVARAFAVPAPPSSFDDGVEFSLTNPQFSTLTETEFEHWSKDMIVDSGDDSDEESESESEEDPYSQLVFGLLVRTLKFNSQILFIEHVIRTPMRCGIPKRWKISSSTTGVLVSTRV